MARRNCRIWWPKDLASSSPPPPPSSGSNLLIFGWFISCSPSSIDIVVASACNDDAVSSFQSRLQEIVRDTNGKMPVFLQDKSMFSLLGHCATFVRSCTNGRISKIGTEEDGWEQPTTRGIGLVKKRRDILRENGGGWSCGCCPLDGLDAGSGHWIQLVCDSDQRYCREIRWIPELDHIHWNGEIVSCCDVHVIVYETPLYGVHHFSLNFWNSSEQAKAPIKKPKWVVELHKLQPLVDLDMVLVAINCTAAAKTVVERHIGSKSSYLGFPIILTCLVFMWQLLAISVASISSILYISLQFFYNVSSFGSNAWMFRTTWANIHLRCCQILYWPVFLQDNGIRLMSCVAYAEKAALRRHAMWSSLAVDLLLGNLIGLALLFRAESACLWVLSFANDVTNELLRSGCVWLMGVPAGFKLNTELAGILGMISLNAIQIWSTLWIFISFLTIYLIKGLAVLGILFGVTIPAALVVDMVGLVTLHVSALHWAISLLYSRQIQALGALWRLFRGRKWNPLRQRLDSYDYNVKQHVVGSLLFTPLLLLLPTTTVFYIFFTMLTTSINLPCVLIEVTISLIHGTPFLDVFLWLVRRRRFPCGIWFETVCSCDSLDFVCRDKVGSLSENSRPKPDRGRRSSTILVSVIHSNFLDIGHIVFPHYKKIFSAVSGFMKETAHGALTELHLLWGAAFCRQCPGCLYHARNIGASAVIRLLHAAQHPECRLCR